jgi:predicted AlkP superfamily pyrophosphatase or phosphodiesterase
MKRRITVEQLQELTEEQKQRLREWWMPQCYDIYYDTIFDDYGMITTDEHGNISKYVMQNKEKLLPLLDIGQMIELLQEKYGEDWIDRIYSVDYDHNIYSLYDGELADALWSEVKQVL